MTLSGVLLAVMLVQTAGPSTVEDELRRAKNEYAYGDYHKAVKLLRDLLYPMKLYSDKQEIEARKYLALSYYLLDKKKLVKEEFTKLLYLDPDYQLDPFSVAPPVIDLLEQVRKAHKTELDVIRQRKSDAKLQTPQPKGIRRTIEKRIIERSDIGTLLPFGVGQFQNGDTGWGVFFLVTEVALLMANIGSYAWIRSLSKTNHKTYGPMYQDLTIAQYASIAVFGITWSIGVVQARLNFVPEIVPPPIVTDEPLNPRAARDVPPMGVRLSLNF